MSETYTSISDSAEETDSDSLSLLRELISKPASPGTLICKRCGTHTWKLKLSKGSDFFILECRNCRFEQFVEFCDEKGED